MPRRSRPRPSDPQDIQLRLARERDAERAARSDPTSWSVANDTVDLPTGETVDVVVGAGRRVVHARRADPFDTLMRAGAMTAGQHQAANRLFRDWCESMGVRTEDPRPYLEIIQHAGSAELIPQRQIDAGRRYDRVLGYCGQATAELLKVLVKPAIMCGSVVIWRSEVRRITAEKHDHAQAAVVRLACEDLRRAYERYDAVDAIAELDERRRRAELNAQALRRA